MNPDELFMREAIRVARSNPTAPFGAVTLDTRRDTIVSTGCNRTVDGSIWDGEIDAIWKASELIGRDDWASMRLYTTAEPCCMCQGAILWAGIGSVVYGTSIQTLLQLGWPQIDLPSIEIAAKSTWSPCQITGGVLGGDCDRLFSDARTINS